MQTIGAHLYFELATDFVLYYSHDSHSPACLQLLTQVNLSRVFYGRVARKRFRTNVMAMRVAIRAMLAIMLQTQHEKNRNVACFQSCPGETPNRDTLRGVRLRN